MQPSTSFSRTSPRTTIQTQCWSRQGSTTSRTMLSPGEAAVTVTPGRGPSSRSTAMKGARLARAALVLTAAALLSCGEPPLSPVPPPQASLIGGLLQATGLLQCTAMPTATATQTVGPAGGGINVGPHRLSIPAGALRAPVTITAPAPSDNLNRIQVQPQGLVLQRAAAL